MKRRSRGHEQFVLVAYDIADEKRLNRVAKTLLGFGDRVEESVFEAWLAAAEIDKRQRVLEAISHPKVDVIRFYFLCVDCVERTRVMGLGKPPEDPEVVVL